MYTQLRNAKSMYFRDSHVEVERNTQEEYIHGKRLSATEIRRKGFVVAVGNESQKIYLWQYMEGSLLSAFESFLFIY